MRRLEATLEETGDDTGGDWRRGVLMLEEIHLNIERELNRDCRRNTGDLMRDDHIMEKKVDCRLDVMVDWRLDVMVD